jgi:predicted peptidase
MHLQDFPTRFVNAYRDRFPCFCLVPQCPGEEWWDGYLAELDAMIDFMLKNPAVDQDRIYLVGVSLGGYGAWSLAAHRPGQFAAVVPICGGGDPGIATSLMKTPLWVIHGEIDRAVPVEEARAMVAAITDAGGNVKYSELAGVGHNSAAWAFDDSNGVFEWIFEQRRVDQTQTGNPLDRASH